MRKAWARRAAAIGAAACLWGLSSDPYPASADEFKTVRECLDLMYYEQAIRLLGNILASDENARDARFWQGFALTRMGRLDQAVIALGGEIERHPDHWPARSLLAYVYYRLKRDADAGTAAREAVIWISKKKPEERAKEPNAGLPFYLLGLLQKDKGLPAAAAADFERAIEHGYDRADGLLRVLECDLIQNSWDDAKAAKAFPALAAAGREYEYYVLAAAGYMKGGDSEAAFKSLEAAYARRPFETGILKTLGCGFAERGDFAEAAVLIDRASKLNPEDMALRSRREDAERRRRVFDGELEKSLEYLVDEVCSGHPPLYRYIFYHNIQKVCGSINQRFLNFLQEGLLNDAASMMKSFIENADVSSTLNYNLGQLYNTLGQIRHAFPFAFQAIRQKPDYRDAHDLIGSLYLGLRDLNRSIEHYQKALELSPDDPVSLYHLGFVLVVSGDLAQAETLLMTAIEKEGLKLPPAESVPSPDRKKTELEFALTIKEDAITYLARLKLGEIAVSKGEYPKALAHYNEASRLRPMAPEPYFEMGRTLILSGDLKRAEDFFVKYLQIGGSEEKVKAVRKK